MKIDRRTLLSRISIVLAGLFASKHSSAAIVTPSAGEGPFYPKSSMRFTDVDNDLVKVVGLVKEAGGEVIHLHGTVTDKNGAPQPAIKVEIWQCDMNGKYLHPGDRQSVDYDKGFQGFGHDITGPDGRYRFRTIKPARYPGRAPHIHVKLIDSDTTLLTTQFYLKDHPDNARDGLFRGMSAEQAASVSMDLKAGPEGPEANVGIVV